MATSNSYNFQNTPTDSIVKEAFERCGLSAEMVSGVQVDSALSSLNFMFTDWVSRGRSLYAEDNQAFSIVPAQSTYSLPIGTDDILYATGVITTRQLNGTAYSSAGGVAQNAFDGNPATACIQTAPNGYISYDYGAGTTYNIQYIGVQSNINTTYTLLIQYSYDNANWYTCSNPGPLSFIAGIPQWFVPAVPQAAQYWRIIETGGSTLNIQEIYFDTHQSSRLMSLISEQDYMAIPNKYTTQSIPNCYVVYKTRQPTLVLWPNPDSTYNLFSYRRQRYVQDVNELLENVDLSQRFYDAIASGLAARLAEKYFKDQYAFLQQRANESYNVAARADVERVPLEITPNGFYQS